MNPPLAPDPIALLREAHGSTRRHLQVIATDTPAGLQAAMTWMDVQVPALHRILAQDLFPALIESMAGSDAVCLKGLTGGLARHAADLERQWRQVIRPALAQGAAPPPDLAAWLTGFDAYLQRCDEELLPMAARLLDDAALNALAQECASLTDLP
jgi:hypothetical protein